MRHSFVAKKFELFVNYRFGDDLEMQVVMEIEMSAKWPVVCSLLATRLEFEPVAKVEYDTRFATW